MPLAIKPSELKIAPATGICLILLLLQSWGMLTMSSSGTAGMTFLTRQAIWCLISWSLLGAFTAIKFEDYKKYLPAIIAAFYLPLILVLIFGVKINGMRGWFDIGGVFFQPSEIAKGLFVLLLYYASEIFQEKSRLLPVLIIIFMAFAIPVALQPDFGTLIVYCCGFAAIIWLLIGRVKLLACSGAAILTTILLMSVKHSYIHQRLTSFWSPSADPSGAGWHIMQFRYTMARGGLFGAGIDQAYWTKAYLPLAHSDSAFAAMIESVGFLGGFTVLAALCILCWCFWKMSLKIPDNKRILIFTGGLMLMTQAMIHISVNITMIPVTGIPFPFFSYGGSSLAGSMILIGIMFSAANSAKEHTENADANLKSGE